MNKITFLAIMMALLFSAGEISQASCGIQKDSKVREKEVRRQLLEQMLKNRTFVFNATDMLPVGSDAVRLNYDCDVQIKDSMMISYLPFFGRSYNLAPGNPNSGFDFTRKIEEYDFKQKRKGYRVKVDIRNGSDYLKYTFHVTETGFSTLSVSSNQRQSISYYGTIDSRK